MTYAATITSKRQLTIPAELFRKINLSQGQKVILTEEKGFIRMESALDMVNRLAGSVKVPKKYRGVDIDQAIKQAKEDYFRHKKI